MPLPGAGLAGYHSGRLPIDAFSPIPKGAPLSMSKPAARFPAALFAFVLSFVALPAHAGVFLSELCDPLNNYTTDRFIEIYNPGPGTVDLTNWKIIAVANGVDANTWTLSGSIGPGEAKVAGSTAPVTVFPIHYASASWLTNYFNWNGKVGDGAKLVDASNVVLDYVLAPGVLFENMTLVRNANNTEPNPVFNASEWTAKPKRLNGSTTVGSRTRLAASPTADTRAEAGSSSTTRGAPRRSASRTSGAGA